MTIPGVDEAERRVDYLFATVERLAELTRSDLPAPSKQPAELQKLKAELDAASTQGDAALDDDLNTPVALAALGEMMRIGNETVMLAQKRKKDASFLGAASALGQAVTLALESLCKQLGLLNVTPAAYAARVKQRRLSLRKLSSDSIEQKRSSASRLAKPKTSPAVTRSERSCSPSGSPSPTRPTAARPGPSLSRISAREGLARDRPVQRRVTVTVRKRLAERPVDAT